MFFIVSPLYAQEDGTYKDGVVDETQKWCVKCFPSFNWVVPEGETHTFNNVMVVAGSGGPYDRCEKCGGHLL